MKRFLILSFIIFSGLFIGTNSVTAEEAAADEWNDMLDFDRSWRTNHKPVTDEEFEKVMKKYEKKKKPKKYEFEANEERDSLNDMSILNDIEKNVGYTPYPPGSYRNRGLHT